MCIGRVLSFQLTLIGQIVLSDHGFHGVEPGVR
jgi:hypothetical protein